MTRPLLLVACNLLLLLACGLPVTSGVVVVRPSVDPHHPTQFMLLGARDRWEDDIVAQDTDFHIQGIGGEKSHA